MGKRKLEVEGYDVGLLGQWGEDIGRQWDGMKLLGVKHEKGEQGVDNENGKKCELEWWLARRCGVVDIIDVGVRFS